MQRTQSPASLSHPPTLTHPPAPFPSLPKAKQIAIASNDPCKLASLRFGGRSEANGCYRLGDAERELHAIGTHPIPRCDDCLSFSGSLYVCVDTHLSACWSVSFPVYLYVCSPISLSVCVLACLPVLLSACLLICISVYVCLCTCFVLLFSCDFLCLSPLSVCVLKYVFVPLSVCLSVCLFVPLSICMYVYLFASLSVCLPVY